VLHVCHGVLYKHMCSWLLYGYVYDPYQEFFIQPADPDSTPGEAAGESGDDDDDDLGIMGVTGRQLQVGALSTGSNQPSMVFYLIIEKLTSTSTIIYKKGKFVFFLLK